MDALRILAAEVITGSLILAAAMAAMARAAWREVAAVRARHERLMDALGDVSWWHG